MHDCWCRGVWCKAHGVYLDVEQQLSCEVGAALGMPDAKLIGGNVIGSLRFSSSDRERRFLAGAGGSFGCPLMERRLMATGMSQILQVVEDLSLKAFVASRCAFVPIAD